MQRDRVAVVGAGGIFEASVAAALATKRRLRIRRFTLDHQGVISGEISAFEPDVVVIVGSTERPIPQAVRAQMEKGAAIVTLDPTEPTMSFSCPACQIPEMCKAPATLDSVLGTVRAARVMLGSRRALETPLHRREEGGAV